MVTSSNILHFLLQCSQPRLNLIIYPGLEFLQLFKMRCSGRIQTRPWATSAESFYIWASFRCHKLSDVHQIRKCFLTSLQLLPTYYFIPLEFDVLFFKWNHFIMNVSESWSCCDLLWSSVEIILLSAGPVRPAFCCLVCVLSPCVCCCCSGLLMQLYSQVSCHNYERETEGTFADGNHLPAALEGCLWIFRLAATLNKRFNHQYFRTFCPCLSKKKRQLQIASPTLCCSVIKTQLNVWSHDCHSWSQLPCCGTVFTAETSCCLFGCPWLTWIIRPCVPCSTAALSRWLSLMQLLVNSRDVWLLWRAAGFINKLLTTTNMFLCSDGHKTLTQTKLTEVKRCHTVKLHHVTLNSFGLTFKTFD